MHRTVRVGLVVLGAAMAADGLAASVGMWPGVVPSAFVRRPVERPRPTMSPIDLNADEGSAHYSWGGNVLMSEAELERWRAWEAESARASAACQQRLRDTAIAPMAAGLALIAVGAWPRRRDANPADAATTSPAGTPAS
ncbi:MAG: hypothetical protein U1E39_13240 [Planctomycetota bacterium]